MIIFFLNTLDVLLSKSDGNQCAFDEFIVLIIIEDNGMSNTILNTVASSATSSQLDSLIVNVCRLNDLLRLFT